MLRDDETSHLHLAFRETLSRGIGGDRSKFVVAKTDRCTIGIRGGLAMDLGCNVR
jgi:hypothetical protein